MKYKDENRSDVIANSLMDLTDSFDLSEEEKIEDVEILQQAAADLLGVKMIDGDIEEKKE